MTSTATVQFARNEMGDYVAQTAIGEFYLTRTGGTWTVELEGLEWDTFESRVVAQQIITEIVDAFAAEDVAAAAERTAAEVAPVAAPQLAPMVWEFNTTGEAYDAAQCDDSIENGAVLIAESEKVVGILIQAWPTAITTTYGAFHGYLTAAEFAALDEDCAEPVFAESYAVALREAEKRGWAIAADALPREPQPEPVADEPAAPAAEMGTAPELLPSNDGGLFGLALTEGTPETGFGFAATAPKAEALALF